MQLRKVSLDNPERRLIAADLLRTLALRGWGREGRRVCVLSNRGCSLNLFDTGITRDLFQVLICKARD